MSVWQKLDFNEAMASPWRRRRVCQLVTDRQTQAALRDISASSAFVETREQPPLGLRVTLIHPEAGSITARVSGLAEDGILLTLDGDERAVAFALGAIVADMSLPN